VYCLRSGSLLAWPKTVTRTITSNADRFH
jgi:hypothetical protein